jgi:hypothetical protein
MFMKILSDKIDELIEGYSAVTIAIGSIHDLI